MLVKILTIHGKKFGKGFQSKVKNTIYVKESHNQSKMSAQLQKRMYKWWYHMLYGKSRKIIL